MAEAEYGITAVYGEYSHNVRHTKTERVIRNTDRAIRGGRESHLRRSDRKKAMVDYVYRA